MVTITTLTVNKPICLNSAMIIATQSRRAPVAGCGKAPKNSRASGFRPSLEIKPASLKFVLDPQHNY